MFFRSSAKVLVLPEDPGVFLPLFFYFLLYVHSPVVDVFFWHFLGFCMDGAASTTGERDVLGFVWNFGANFCV